MSADLLFVDPATALPQLLLALAPLRLPNHRRLRYSGDDQAVKFDELAKADQTLLRQFYRVLTELLYVIADPETDDPGKWRGVVRWLETHDLDRLVDDVRQLGLASYEQHPGEMLAKVMHDLRGGGLSPLIGRLQLFEQLPQNEASLKAIFVLTRDHLKIMRNAIEGLDEPRRNADRTPKTHAMRLMLEKWQDAIIGPHWRERPIRLKIDCRYDGPLTECCLESAAVDRVFYNLAINACRHASGDRLDMVVFSVMDEDEDSDCLRFVLSNEVSEENATRLRGLEEAGGVDGADQGPGLDLKALFEPGISSTGSGFGLTVVADFVAGAFGLRDRAEALQKRYVGAVLDGQTFRVWFHWPKAHGGLPEKLDDYRRPQESLSDV